MIFTHISPSQYPKQDGSLLLLMYCKTSGSSTVTEVEALHPISSVIVTV